MTDEKDLDIFIRYPYGAFYDASKPEGMKTSTDIVIYASLDGVVRAIESLEGYFISKNPLPSDSLVCSRDQMGDFERKYSGMFETFEEHFRRR